MVSRVAAQPVSGFGTERMVNAPNTVVKGEPTIAAGNAQYNYIVAVYMDTGSLRECISYRSTDGGQTWGSRQSINNQACNDPVVRYGYGSVFYLVYLEVLTGGYTYLDFEKSTDGGASWGSFVTIDSGVVGGCGTQLDKPWMAVDVKTGNIYVSYTVGKPTGLVATSSCPLGFKIEFARSTDTGATWTHSDVTGYSSTDFLTLSSIAVSPVSFYETYNDVLVAFFDGPGFVPSGQGQFSIKFARSSDFGQTFTNPITVVTANDTPEALCGFPWRVRGTMAPHIASGEDPFGQNSYYVYIVYGARPAPIPSGNCVPNSGTDDADIYFLKSQNRGDTWSTPVDLTPGGSTANNNPDQFMPSIIVDWNQDRGLVHVAYADMGIDTTQNNRYQVMQVQSTPSAVVWTTPLPVASTMGYSTAGFIGDYFDMASVGGIGNIIPIWTDLRGGAADLAEIYTAVSTFPPSQNDCGAAQDTGKRFVNAYTIAPGTCNGYFYSSYDLEDWYQFNVAASGSAIKVSITPPSNSVYNLELYDPSGSLVAKSYPVPAGQSASISYTSSTTGYFRIHVFTNPNTGIYSMSLSINPPPGCSASASPTSGSLHVTVSFSSSCIGGTPPYRYNWQFNDGSGATSTAQNPSYTYYPTSGCPIHSGIDYCYYYPLVTVTDANGASTSPSVPQILVTCTDPCLSPHFTPQLQPDSASLSSADSRILFSNLTVTWNQGEQAIPVNITLQAPTQLQPCFTYTVTKIAQPATNVAVYQLTINIKQGVQPGTYPIQVSVQEIGPLDQVQKTILFQLTVTP